jgi:TPR repeat protein
MKGQKAYSSAIEIHKILYSRGGELNESEKTKLYNRYFALIKKAAYLGHSEGLFDLGQQYEDISFLGIPNPLYNPQKCVYWYSKACKNGHAEACNNLAHLYEKGEGCHQNLNLAFQLYQRSADLGSPNGKKNYKIMRRDLSKGGKYYQ